MRGIGVENQQLYRAGKLLQDELTLAEYNISDGKGHILSLLPTDATEGDSESPGSVPTKKPPFTLKDLRDAIPKHCFERSYLRSFGYLALDLIKLATLGLGFMGFDAYVTPAVPTAVTYLFYAVYIFSVGTVAMALWVIAHECGHHAFSPSHAVNDIVGWILHSALLVPYHAWRVSHRKHHAKTAHMEDDEVFVPATRSEIVEHITSTPIVTAIEVVGMLLIGWPLYLLFNSSGPRKYHQPGLKRSHFEPDSALFAQRDRMGIIAGNIGLVLSLTVSGSLTYCFGWRNMFLHYWGPYLIVNAYLVSITYLHHTAVYLPHYSSEEWDWLRGALSTVDRSAGKMIDSTLHHIQDLHVCHHLFSKMPFDHHEEATEAMKPILGDYYVRDDTHPLIALWQSGTSCLFVEDEGRIRFYKS